MLENISVCFQNGSLVFVLCVFGHLVQRSKCFGTTLVKGCMDWDTGLFPCSGTIILFSTNVSTSSCPSCWAHSNEFWIASVARSLVAMFCSDPGEADANNPNFWKAESTAISSSLSRFCHDLVA